MFALVLLGEHKVRPEKSMFDEKLVLNGQTLMGCRVASFVCLWLANDYFLTKFFLGIDKKDDSGLTLLRKRQEQLKFFREPPGILRGLERTNG